MKRFFQPLAIILIFLVSGINSYSQNNKLHVIYNNMDEGSGLIADWGYAAWIESGDEVYLFDTGARSDILLSNMYKLGLDPKRIEQLIISHLHGDHTGGLIGLADKLKPGIPIYIPEKLAGNVPESFNKLNFIVETGFKNLGGPIWITDVKENQANHIKEHALILEREGSYIVVTGCAHPGISEMCKSFVEKFPDKTPELVTGGFHLIMTPENQVSQLSDSLKELGFQKAGPSHCTGENAINVFKKEWGDQYIRLFLGDAYTF